MLELYTLDGCPFCAKVERKLNDLDLEYERRQVPAARSQRNAVLERSGQRGVPVLVDSSNGIDGLAESNDIVTYLERVYG